MSWLTWPARRVRAVVLLCQAAAAQRQGDLWAKDAGGMSSGYFALGLAPVIGIRTHAERLRCE